MKVEEVIKDLIRDPDDLFRALGKAFRPDLTHFSDLSLESQIRRRLETPILRELHDDWPVPFNTIERSATVFFGDPPKSGLKPILKPGESYSGDGYMTLTTDEGLHIRHGFRYDDVDNYYTYVPLTIKRIRFEKEKDGVDAVAVENTLGQILDIADLGLFFAALIFPGLKVVAAGTSLINHIEEGIQKAAKQKVDPSILKDQGPIRKLAQLKDYGKNKDE
jgi:hypothetical protein